MFDRVLEHWGRPDSRSADQRRQWCLIPHLPVRLSRVITAATATLATLVAGCCLVGPRRLRGHHERPGAGLLPVNYDFAAGAATTFNSPKTPPPGANNFSCQPSAAHPHPVVLVHGTLANMDHSWQAASPILVNHGYCVFAFNYGGSSRPPTSREPATLPRPYSSWRPSSTRYSPRPARSKWTSSAIPRAG